MKSRRNQTWPPYGTIHQHDSKAIYRRVLIKVDINVSPLHLQSTQTLSVAKHNQFPLAFRCTILQTNGCIIEELRAELRECLFTPAERKALEAELADLIRQRNEALAAEEEGA
ncbi:hypothetical protein [Bradyrhizobium cosmicum]|uniref:hypothetical protein n=1 Tax=Bradyrhizobium cosmicum TaxID=1404864 RepID=UPI0028EEB66A|nr:hypothetical protein [Bradyrhizobium cosmicum]